MTLTLTEVIAGIPASTLPISAFIAFLAAILRAFTGFGFAVASVPLFAMVLPISQALVLSAGLSLFISYFGSCKTWKNVTLSGYMLAAMLAGTVLGISLLQRVPAPIFMVLMGFTVVASCAVLGFYRPAIAPAATRRRHIVTTGFLSGLGNGLFAMPGPPAVVYALSTYRDPDAARGYLIKFFMVTSIVALSGYALAGYITATSAILLAVSLPMLIIGDRLGAALFTTHSARAYRPVSIALLFVSGFSSVAKGIMDLV
jgi:uncharacterized membrane protein YfcA